MAVHQHLNNEPFDDDPLWYKDAIIYEVHIRAFFDSNADGVGDIRGLTKKLDYLADVGITAIWLLPFYPSPLRDDGYDVSDYFSIHPSYGTLSDFQKFLRQAHMRGIRVIIELALNHTSDTHPWFQRARTAAPGSDARNFYVWSETADGYREARIIFSDSESSNWSWDPVAHAYYWHRFYAHQPDLNYANLNVQKAMGQVVDFWLEMGVDGLRLDAVPYLFEQEGTSCENLPETHRFLKDLRRQVDRSFQNRMLLAEANQWPEDAVAYFGEGDEAHMAYHFPLMPRLFMALSMENSFPVIDIINQTPRIPDSCQWGLFLRNHDELTLEMVTDEERDYMYRVFAQDPNQRINLGIRRRLAPLMKNDRREMELMYVLLFSFPGSPILYYGDEIGMGDNFYLGDRNGVRTPMQWSADKNAGFSRANPQKLYLPVIIDPEFHYEAVNVEIQESNPSSFLWWMKRLIATRKKYPAFSRGTIRFLKTYNPRIIAFTREYRDEILLVLANLSKSAQYVRLLLDHYQGWTPVELFSHIRFPPIPSAPYTFSFGPHDYFWFTLQKPEATAVSSRTRTIPEFPYRVRYSNILECREIDTLATFFYQYFRKYIPENDDSSIVSNSIIDQIPVGTPAEKHYIILLNIDYSDGLNEVCCIPVSYADGSECREIRKNNPERIIVFFPWNDEPGIFYESLHNQDFQDRIFTLVAGKGKARGRNGSLICEISEPLKKKYRENHSTISSRLYHSQGITPSILYDNEYLLKLYRLSEEGINPDIQVTHALSEGARFAHTPEFLGSLLYKGENGQFLPLGMVERFISCEDSAWSFTLDSIGRFFQNLLLKKPKPELIPPPSEIDITMTGVPLEIVEAAGIFYLDMVYLLGQRTAEFHLALLNLKDTPGFKPEPYSYLYQRSIYQSFHSRINWTLGILENNLKSFSPGYQQMVHDILASKSRLFTQLRMITDHPIRTIKMRIHGDCHLGQVLFTGKDFIIHNFEGDPTRSMSERRLKYCPLRDVGGMIWSLGSAIQTSLLHNPSLRPEDLQFLEPWAEIWLAYMESIFMTAYMRTVHDAPFIPDSKQDIMVLLNSFIIERAMNNLRVGLMTGPDNCLPAIRAIRVFLKKYHDFFKEQK
jgi:maltose alpha-D-glucosyltransferase/alpha-amylase